MIVSMTDVTRIVNQIENVDPNVGRSPKSQPVRTGARKPDYKVVSFAIAGD